MWSLNENWTTRIYWDTPAGIALKALVSHIPEDLRPTLYVFGSSPLQLGLEPSFLSADVDLFSDADLSEFIRLAGLEKGKSKVYIEQTPASVFLASPAWTARAFKHDLNGVKILLAHPLDVLVGKIKRLEEKDLNAYRLVHAMTKHPTEDELTLALQEVVDVYRPAFDEEDTGGDPWGNTVRVWQELFKKPIDVRASIVVPALSKRRESYGLNNKGLKDELRKI